MSYVLSWESETGTSKHFCFTFKTVYWGTVLNCLYFLLAQLLLLQILCAFLAFYWQLSISVPHLRIRNFAHFVFVIDISRCFMFYFQVQLLIKCKIFFVALCFLCHFYNCTNAFHFKNKFVFNILIIAINLYILGCNAIYPLSALAWNPFVCWK